MKVKSPITNNFETKLIESIDVNLIVDIYNKSYNIDVSDYFGNYAQIYLYECTKTKYRFFYPFGISGDSQFYSQLEKFDWYYMKWKWEHQIANDFIRDGDQLLEIGCAHGDFLKKIVAEKKIMATGLELNDSVNQSTSFQTLHESIETHAERFHRKYDVVCAFEVLEHVEDINSFVTSCKASLKSNGLLIFAVPNNDSFIRVFKQANVLNYPPHHVGHWNEKSLKKLAKEYNLELVQIEFEPIQDYHKLWFEKSVGYTESIIHSKIIINWILKYSPAFLKWRIELIIRKIIRFQIGTKGHTVLAVFRKKEN